MESSSTKSPQAQSPQCTERDAGTTKSPQGEHITSTTPCRPPRIIADQDIPSVQPTTAIQDSQSPQSTRKESSITKSPQYESSTQEESPQPAIKYNIKEILKKPKIELQDCTVQERQPKNLRQPQLDIQQPKNSKQQKPTRIVVLKPPTQHDQPSRKKLPTKKKKVETTSSNIRKYLSCTNISRSTIISANIQEQYLEDNISTALQTHVLDRTTPVPSGLHVSKAQVPHSDNGGFSQSEDNDFSQSEATIFNNILPCNKLNIGARDEVNQESGPPQNQESCISCGLSLKREGLNPYEYVCFNCCQI